MTNYIDNARQYLYYADNQADEHSAQLAIAAAAIAQAEAAEKAAVALVRIADMLEMSTAGNGSGRRLFFGVEVLDKTM